MYMFAFLLITVSRGHHMCSTYLLLFSQTFIQHIDCYCMPVTMFNLNMYFNEFLLTSLVVRDRTFVFWCHWIVIIIPTGSYFESLTAESLSEMKWSMSGRFYPLNQAMLIELKLFHFPLVIKAQFYY